MTRRLLIDAQKSEELRIAIIEDGRLENYQVEVADQSLRRGSIYRGIIATIQPSLNAAFVDYGGERHGFLAIQDVVPPAYYHPPKGNARPRIDDVLERGKPIVVQVQKDAEGQKGAVLTTNLSLAGRYLVLTPFDDTIGVSRKVEDDDLRKELREQASKLEVPSGSGVIVRTNALDQTKADLTRDLAALLRLWKQIQTEARSGKGIRLLHSDEDLIVRALRDHLDRGVTEILIDEDRAYEKAQEYLRTFMPRGKIKVDRYTERLPLFARFDLEPQIDRIYRRTVELPAGGSIVIDRTEALTAIDVNSGRATRGSTQEETAVTTNLEAAREVARQLRLRDIGGLVVVDFIDMRSGKNRQKVEKLLRDEMKADKARSTVGRISANGLLEINRQKIQQSLSLRTHRACPTCGGTGRIASPEMVGLNLLRRVEARAATGLVKKVRISLHPELADFVQNSRRQEFAAIEEEFDIRVEVLSSPRLRRADQEVEWFDREPGDVPRPRPASAAAAAPIPARPAEAPESGAAAPAVAQEKEGEATRARRPRRRRRRRNGTAADGAGSPAGEAIAAAADADSAVPDASAPPPGETGPGGLDAEAARRRRRRRRRRKRGGNGGEDSGGGEGGDDVSSPDQEAGGADDGESPRPGTPDA